MKYIQKQPAVLLLEDETVYLGNAVGKKGTATGEICFNTGMTGYQEIFTDPSYYGQILITTLVHIGNYGINSTDVESDSIKIAGLVCKNFSARYSRTSAANSIQEYFAKEEKVGISDVDTRSLVRHIRDKGAMNAVISSEETDIEKLKETLKKIPPMDGLELSSKVTTPKPYITGAPDSLLKVAVLDLGVKKNILRCLQERSCCIKVFPMNTTYEAIEEWKPDGILLSNGPGDPSAMTGVVETTKKIIAGKIPVLGICLGHQVIARACGLSTYKMHNGHRGVNHPVKNLATGRCEITSQNHGFVVSKKDAEANQNIEITHIHVNDGTLAGMKLKNKNISSVQFHPEASAGPHDSRYIFDEFIENLKTYSEKTNLIFNT